MSICCVHLCCSKIPQNTDYRVDRLKSIVEMLIKRNVKQEKMIKEMEEKLIKEMDERQDKMMEEMANTLKEIQER